MKKSKVFFLSFVVLLLLTSCGTLLTPAKQNITFVGLPETSIYDEGKKIGTINDEGETTIEVGKKLSDKVLIAKKKGYKNTYVKLNAVFNPVSVLNLTNALGWCIDLISEKCCKWDTNFVEIEQEKAE